MISKKGQLGEQIMMFAFMFLLVVVGGGIVLGTYFFIGPEFDFRSVEANLLVNSIKQCLSDGSLKLDGLAEEQKSDTGFIAEKCNLNKEVIEKNNLIKICVSENNLENCINEADNSKIAFSMKGDFTPCGLTDKNKFLGCFIEESGEYTIIATSRQNIRRSAK